MQLITLTMYYPPHTHTHTHTHIHTHNTHTQPQSSGSEEVKREEVNGGGDSSGSDDKKVDVPDPNEPSGFARGLTPEEIMGATEMEGKILFLMKW